MPGKVPPAIAAARAARLGELSRSLHRRFAERFSGTEALVLFEGSRRGGMMYGFTENYIKVGAPYDASRVNTISKIVLGDWDEKAEALVSDH
jgi:threonylcarbamoyladenosine tRNA methylthiotransferase MtaB